MAQDGRGRNSNHPKRLAAAQRETENQTQIRLTIPLSPPLPKLCVEDGGK
jgi:hypothetical protein